MATVGYSAYVDVAGYLESASGQETASLLGLNTTLTGTSAAPAGATTLQVVSSVGWAAGPLWLLDGPYSEVVMVSGSADATHLTLAAPGTQFTHSVGASASQAGTAGSLAESILRASAWMEGYCQQGTGAGDRSLYAVSRTERWGMPSSRAWLDRDGVLVARPGHFPVLSVSALAVEFGAGNSRSFDMAQLELPTSGRLVEIPYLLASALTPGQRLALDVMGISRSARQWLTLTYVGGFAAGALPYDLRQACVWLTSDLLATRRNPAGAAVIHQGKFELQARLRGDETGDSLLRLQAKAALEPYRERGM